MKPLTAEWVAKAEGDMHTAERELRARKNANPDSACFHAQQCAEKYLKARLQEAMIAFHRTHDLVELLDLLLPLEPTWLRLRPDLKVLTAHAVQVRYPGLAATKAVAKTSVTTCREVRRLVRIGLGLKP